MSYLMRTVHDRAFESKRDRAGGVVLPVLVAIVVVVVLAVLAVGLNRSNDDVVQAADRSELHVVDRGDFTIVVPAKGELATAQKQEIRNLLESRAMITEIVDEGTTVAKGTVLLRLADDEILDKIKDGEDKVKTAETSVVTAEQTLAIRRSTMASDLEKADLEIEIAELAKKAWEEGEVVSKRQTLALGIETKQINRDRLQKRFADAKSLLDNGYISLDEYEQDRIKLIEAEAALKEANLAEQVYERYTIKQERAQKLSAVDQSMAEKERVRQRHEAEIVKIEADVGSARFRLQTAQERLDDLKAQLDSCIVRAPSDGLVVYASSLSGERRGRGDEPPPQVGTELRQNELVMILPDVTRMMANLKVGEALSGRILAGQSVVVYSDSLPNVPIQGRVEGVSVLAESGGWRDPNRRDYTVKVLLTVDPGLGLKPSMRCRGEIVLGEVEDVVNVPVQSVFRRGPTAYVYVPEDGGFAEREVRVGRASEMNVEIVDGLALGDTVLLRRPSPGEVVAELPAASGGMQWTGGRPNGAGGPPTGVGRPATGGGGPPRGKSSATVTATSRPSTSPSQSKAKSKAAETKTSTDATTESTAKASNPGTSRDAGSTLPRTGAATATTATATR